MSAGMSSTSHSRPRSSLYWIAFMLIRSTIPWNSASAPIGSWTGTGFAPRRSRMVAMPMSKFGPDAVHLVDVGDPRHAVLVGLAPHGLGLRLDAGDGVEQRDRAVEDAQRALDLDREVDVAGGVDDVHPVVGPVGGGGRGGDRDPALLLLGHPVHRRGALVDLAELVRAPRVEQDALGGRRLAGVDVRHDPDVAGLLEWKFAGHLGSVSGRGGGASLAVLGRSAAGRKKALPGRGHARGWARSLSMWRRSPSGLVSRR